MGLVNRHRHLSLSGNKSVEDLSIGESSNKYAKAISMIGTSQESVLYSKTTIDIEEAMTAGVPSKISVELYQD